MRKSLIHLPSWTDDSRRYPQPLRQFGAALSVLQKFGPDVRQSQAARGAFEQPDTELALELGDAAADRRDWHVEAGK